MVSPGAPVLARRGQAGPSVSPASDAGDPLELELARSGAVVTGTRKRLDEALDDAVPTETTPKRDKRLRVVDDLFASMRL